MIRISILIIGITLGLTLLIVITNRLTESGVFCLTYFLACGLASSVLSYIIGRIFLHHEDSRH